SRHDVCEQWRVEEGGCHHVLQAADNIAGFLQGLFEGAAFDLALDRSLNIEVAVEKAEKVQREEQFAIAIDDDTRSQPEQRPVQVDAVQAGRSDGDVKAGQGYYGVAEIENRVLGVAARDAQHQIERHNSRDRDRPQQPWPQWGDGPHTRSERSEEEGAI